MEGEDEVPNSTKDDANNGVHRSPPHPFVAGIADFYLIGMAGGAVLALGTSVSQTPFPLIGVPFFVLLEIALTVIYHLHLKKKTLWLSPGEVLAGCVVHHGEKVWTNPYGVNRWVLFPVLLFTLVLISNSWDGLSNGRVYTIGQVFGTVVWLSAASIGILVVGTGNPWGAALVFAGLTVPVVWTMATAPGAAGALLVFFGPLAVLNVLAALFYHGLRRSPN